MSDAAHHAAGARRPTGRREAWFAGLGTLIRFQLHRDRLYIPIWVFAIAGMTVLVNLMIDNFYGEGMDLQLMAIAMDNPAMVAMSGRNYAGVENVTLGSLFAQQMLWFTLSAVAIMGALMLIRHTRAEEETNRAELVRAGVVGRHALLTAALIVVGIANLAIALIMAVGLGAAQVETIDWPGSWLFGATHFAVGMSFAGIAAVTAQLTQSARGAIGLSLGVIGVAYVLRGLGDLAENSLVWLSPIGWGQATRVFVENIWWPLLVAAAGAVAFTAIAFFLSARRDLGAGLLAGRPGRARASALLTTPLGFALRLHRGLLLAFAFGMLLLGASYGSVLGDVELMFEGLGPIEAMLAGMRGSLIIAFASMILTIMSIIACVYVAMALGRPRSEEWSGRAEPLLATALSRRHWLASHVCVVFGGSLVMLAAMGLGLGLAGQATADEEALLSQIMLGAFAYAPAHWFVIGVGMALYGWMPRAYPLVWLVLAYAFVTVYLGNLLQFPDWMTWLSPFSHVPQMPADDFAWPPLMALTALAAILTVLGFYGLGRRDLDLK